MVRGKLLDGLEQALEGKTIGEQFSVTLQPADTCGDELPELIQTLHMDEFNGVEMRAGMELQGEDPDGNFRLIRVQKVEGDRVTVNMNHPLAGIVLYFALGIKYNGQQRKQSSRTVKRIKGHFDGNSMSHAASKLKGNWSHAC